MSDWIKNVEFVPAIRASGMKIKFYTPEFMEGKVLSGCKSHLMLIVASTTPSILLSEKKKKKQQWLK